MYENTTIQTLYKYNLNDRDVVLNRVRDYCVLTIPDLLPLEDTDSKTDVAESGTQSLGAELVKKLANKLVLSIFPARPFFKATLDAEDTNLIMNKFGISSSQIQNKLSTLIMLSYRWLTLKGVRAQAVELMQHLIIAGNALLHFPKDKMVQLYSLADYVIGYDAMKELQFIITRDVKIYKNLSVEHKLMLMNTGTYEDDQEVSLYTYIRRKDGNYKKFIVTQALDDVDLQEESEYTEDTLPWIPQQWKLRRGSSYGGSLLDEHYTAFKAHELFGTSIQDAAVVASYLRILVNTTSGMTKVSDINTAKNGEAVQGRKDDIEFLSLGNKVYDFQWVAEVQAKIEMHLSRIFLSQSAQTRNAERVTAEEIRANAEEINTMYGGYYDEKAHSLQRPLALLALSKIPKISIDFVTKSMKLDVLTGFDALSTSYEASAYQQFLTIISQLNQMPPRLLARIKEETIFAKIADSLGIDPSDVVNDEEAAQENMAEDRAINRDEKLAEAQINNLVANE